MVSPVNRHNYNYDNAPLSPLRSSPRSTLDELIRRELRVDDPSNPEQISQALLSRYKDLSSAKGITQEAKGTPSIIDVPATPIAEATTSSHQELQQAIDDVEHDFRELLQNNLLKDVGPELEGWQMAIRFAIDEGTTAARMSLDTRQRDKAFGIRRTLGDYARLARLVGTLTPSLSQTYRKLAQSLDEVAAVILVMMGEALASVGFSGGRFLLQVPFTELKVRRDAAIYALRQLITSTEDTYDPNNWHRGINAYRQLFNLLEKRGEGDLRVLLLENELARIMDELIQRASRGQSDGLRALGATAQIDLERLRRLVIVGKSAVNPPSPALITFLDTLLLFIQAFDPSGGFRLLKIARPPILFYGLYGVSGLDDAERKLLDLIERRGRLAEQLDCFLNCDCSPTKVKQQVVLDKILYDVDRAIDLYAISSAIGSEPEQRAVAYGYLIKAALEDSILDLSPNSDPIRLEIELDAIRDELLAEYPQQQQALLQQELCVQKSMEQRWENLVRTMAPSCVEFSTLFGKDGVITMILDNALTDLGASGDDTNCDVLALGIPEDLATSNQSQSTSQAVLATNQLLAAELDTELDIRDEIRDVIRRRRPDLVNFASIEPLIGNLLDSFGESSDGADSEPDLAGPDTPNPPG